MTKNLFSILIISSALLHSQQWPAPTEQLADTRARFHGIATVQVGRHPCTASIRVEDLGSAGSPNHNKEYRNRWHYVVAGCAIPLLSGLWTMVTVSNSGDGSIEFSAASWGIIRYVPIDEQLRPKEYISESNWQRVSIRRIAGDSTYEILIEEPAT